MAWYKYPPHKKHYVRSLSKSIAYQMGLQISCSIRTKAKKKGIIRQNQKSIRSHIPRTCKTKGMSDCRRTCNARSYPHADLHTPEVRCILNHRISEGQECHCDCETILWQRAQLYGGALLGTRLCSINGRIRTGNSPTVRPGTRRHRVVRRIILIH